MPRLARNVVVGLAVGAFVGLLIGLLSVEGDDDLRFVATILYAALGGAIGMLIAPFVRSRSAWRGRGVLRIAGGVLGGAAGMLLLLGLFQQDWPWSGESALPPAWAGLRTAGPVMGGLVGLCLALWPPKRVRMDAEAGRFRP